MRFLRWAMTEPTEHGLCGAAIQRMVQDKLAVKILDGTVAHGDHVVVDADGKTNRDVDVFGSTRSQ